MDQQVRSVLGRVFPDREPAAVEESAGSGHAGNRTLRVRFADGGVAYLKLRVDGDRERNAREAAVTRYASGHCDLRVPDLLAADSAGEPPYLATAPLAGTPVGERWEGAGWPEREELARVAGLATAGVASARLDEPGWITGGDGDRLDRDVGPWSAVLAGAVERRAEEVPYPDRFGDVPGRVTDLLRESGDRLDGAEAALLHGDLRFANLFVDGRPGAIDWEWTLVGDPGLGLCWTESWVVERADVPGGRRDDLRAALRDGYRAAAGGLPLVERREPLYRLVAFLPTVQTFDAWAPEATEPVEELADWVRGELDDRLAAASDGQG